MLAEKKYEVITSSKDTKFESIVHDLKNPIGAIVSLAELCLSSSVEDSERDLYLTHIKGEALRMLSMAEDILTTECETKTAKMEHVLVSKFLRDVEGIAGPWLKKYNVDAHFHAGFEGIIEIDASYMQRIILNIVKNSIEAFSDQDKTNKIFGFSIDRSQNDLLISLKDNGPGMPESVKSSIFSSSITCGKVNGTGIGLVNVRDLVEKQGGDIRYLSSTGLGTSFYITIPDACTDGLDRPIVI